jgi:hypothetical protein
VEIVSIRETHEANRWLTETNIIMSTVYNRDVVDGVETPVVVKEEGTGRIANINRAEIGKDSVTVGGEIHIKQAGVRDAEGDTGEHHDYCDEISDISPAAKLNGIDVKENTSGSDNRNRTTSETWTAENTEDDCIVDFLDKNNEKVYLSLSHP